MILRCCIKLLPCRIARYFEMNRFASRLNIFAIPRKVSNAFHFYQRLGNLNLSDRVGKNFVRCSSILIAKRRHQTPEWTLQLYPTINLGFTNVRYKYTKKYKGKGRTEDSDSDDDYEEEESQNVKADDEDENDEIARDYKDLTAQMISLRIDTVLKHGMGLARNKIDDAFYAGKFRVNGQKVLKKSKQVNIGDENDFILGVDPENPKFLKVVRVIVMNANHLPTGKLQVKLRRFKNLTVQNYDDSWKPETTENE